DTTRCPRHTRRLLVAVGYRFWLTWPRSRPGREIPAPTTRLQRSTAARRLLCGALTHHSCVDPRSKVFGEQRSEPCGGINQGQDQDLPLRTWDRRDQHC